MEVSFSILFLRLLEIINNFESFFWKSILCVSYSYYFYKWKCFGKDVGKGGIDFRVLIILDLRLRFFLVLVFDNKWRKGYWESSINNDGRRRRIVMFCMLVNERLG